MKVRRKLSVLESKRLTKERSILLIDTDVPRTFAHLVDMDG